MRRQAEEQRLKAALKQYEAPEVKQEKKELVKLLAVKSMQKKNLTQGKPLFQRLIEQGAYISPLTWVLQGVLLLLTLSRFAAPNVMQLFTALSVMAPLLGLIGGCELIRSYGHNMWELEMACRYNLRSIFAMKMLIVGFLDLVILGTAMFLAGQSGASFALLTVMILVPFNLSNSLYLWMIIRLRHRCSNYVLAGTGGFLSLVMLWLRGLTDQKLIADVLARYIVAIPMAAVSLALVILMAAILLRSSGKGYNQWNYI